MNDIFVDIIIMGGALLLFVITLIGAGASAKKGVRAAAVWALLRLIFGFAAFVVIGYKAMQLVGLETIVILAAVGIAALVAGFGFQKNFRKRQIQKGRYPRGQRIQRQSN